MEKFLEDLRASLEEAGVENRDEIIEKYLEHFSIGHEAGMSDEEIIERFDSIQEIVSSCLNDTRDEEKEFKLELDLSWFKRFELVLTEGKSVRLEVDEEALRYIDVLKTELAFSIKNKPYKGHFGKKDAFEGTLYIGRNLSFDKVFIENVSGDVDVCSLKSNNVLVNNVSGDMNFDSLNVKEKLKIINVSGDIEVQDITVPNLNIETVNGDIKIEEICCDNVKLKTVNGDLVIGCTNEANYVVDSVNGDVKIQKGEIKEVSVTTINGEFIVEGKKISTSKISEVVKNTLSSVFKDWKF